MSSFTAFAKTVSEPRFAKMRECSSLKNEWKCTRSFRSIGTAS